MKCEYLLCKSCCKLKCHLEDLQCIGHKINVKNKRKQQESKEEYGDKDKNGSKDCEGQNIELQPAMKQSVDLEETQIAESNLGKKDDLAILKEENI